MKMNKERVINFEQKPSVDGTRWMVIMARMKESMSLTELLGEDLFNYIAWKGQCGGGFSVGGFLAMIAPTVCRAVRGYTVLKHRSGSAEGSQFFVVYKFGFCTVVLFV